MAEPDLWQPYDPYPEPAHPQWKARGVDGNLIRIRHPCYPDETCDTLLNFWSPAHHETVRIACAIVASNAWEEGYLSTDRDGNDPLDRNPEIALRSASYYFHAAQPINGTAVDYPVVPNFEHWPYPSTLPSYWTEISLFPQTAQPPIESHYCRLTQCDYSVENAHLVPAAEREWFDKNSMCDYTDSTAIDEMKHPNNTVRFRSDIHTVFDAKRFAIVPVGRRLVAYCFHAQPGSHIERLHHRVELHRLQNPPQLLLARFAYTVFEGLRAFLNRRVERMLQLRLGNSLVVEKCDAEKCQQSFRATASQGKSRSVSPKKRSRSQADEETDIESSDNGKDLRGRKRHRSDEPIRRPLSFSRDASSFVSEDQSIPTSEESRLPLHFKTDDVPISSSQPSARDRLDHPG
ncbi:hypothetical protein PV08_07040 [Exophiala spinifera]|uniref:HNH nuclease domain-containing protein n=1 Tax=Exophiala spinifera TaxID=91928 RepID=A0A0D2B5P6_9EURO|nr:uncharacterized protein PV08_07040 [Exophiala spinifera]KIW14258.1 hypothetical protein PV08_07040 [Exophiala spinifera]